MTLERRIRQSTLARPIAIAATVALLGVFGVYELIVLTQVIGPRLGEDRLFFQAIGQRWLDGAPVYLPHQLAGPYQVTLQVDNLYPPTALLLFVPLTFLPAFVWWLVPLSVTVYVIARWRPAWWAWPLMALIFLWPKTISSVLWGNTDMWAVAAVAAGLRWGWPAVFLLLKPTLAPFALVGVRKRSFWVVGAAMVALGLFTLPLWFDYFTAMRNLRIPWDYSLVSIPPMFLPIVAWAARTSDRGENEKGLIPAPLPGHS
jgi:hypothetical protein